VIPSDSSAAHKASALPRRRLTVAAGSIQGHNLRKVFGRNEMEHHSDLTTSERPRSPERTTSHPFGALKACSGQASHYRFSRSYFTAPNVNPLTNCFCVNQPITMIGATASREAAESCAKN
jgi:hypothetical protein